VLGAPGAAVGAGRPPAFALGVVAQQYGPIDTKPGAGVRVRAPAGGIDARSGRGLDSYTPRGIDT